MNGYSVSDYLDALQSLMPTGLAWPRELSRTQTGVLRALAKSFYRSGSDAVSLIEGGFPATATIMLREWELTLGLPDDCAIGEIDSISARQRSVVSRLIGTGGLTRGYFIKMATELGYEITITQFRQARCGMSVCGDALNGEEWPFTWLINAPETTITYAQAGISYCGDPLRSWGNKQLECMINRLAPSHIRIIFGYQE